MSAKEAFDKEESLDASFGRSHTSQSSEQPPVPPPRSPGERRRSISSGISGPSTKGEKEKEKEGDHVKVVCRVRPFNRREAEIQEEINSRLPEYERQPMRSVIDMTNQSTLFLDHNNEYQVKERFNFDENMWSIPDSMQSSDAPFADQAKVMEKVGQVAIDNAMSGYNSCILAYGQTGSGKTYTMTGSDDDKGLIPRCCEELFDRIRSEQQKTAGQDTQIDYRVELQFLEIYNDAVKDLLAELAATEGSPMDGGRPGGKIQLRQSAAGVSQVVGAASIIVTSWADCERLLDIGGLNRAFATTKMNDASSRSHAIVRLTVTRTLTVKPHPSRPYERPKTFDRVSLINLVDLAGSERQKKSGAEGQQLVEACAINFSLSVLMRVIDALVSRTKPPYRECQLTWFLMESLGGNSKTFVIACVSPHADNAEETHNTLRWALRTQGIVNEARVNESDEARRILQLQQQVESAKRALQENTESSKTADLMRDVEEKRSAMDALLAQRSVQERAERDLQATVEEEKVKTYRLRYANSFRMILFGRMADGLATRREMLARRKQEMDIDQSAGRSELDRAEAELSAVRQEEALLAQQVGRLAKDHAAADAKYQETTEEVRRMDRNASLNALQFKSATMRATCTRIVAHVTARAHAKRLQRRLEDISKQQARDKQDITRRGNEARAAAQGAHQRSIDRVHESIKNFSARIAEVDAKIKATDADRAARLREFNSKITFLEHENRNINDARLKLRAQLDREESQQYDKKSTELSEENVRRCQAAEQEHKAILLESARQQRYAIAETERRVHDANERYSQLLADMEVASERALADQAAHYADTVGRHDAQIEDASTFMGTWRHGFRRYGSVKDEIDAMVAQLGGSRDPEVRAMLDVLKGRSTMGTTRSSSQAPSPTYHATSSVGSTVTASTIAAAPPALNARSVRANGSCSPVGSNNVSAAGSPTHASATGYVGRPASKLGSRKSPSQPDDSEYAIHDTSANSYGSSAFSAPRMSLGSSRRAR